MTKSSREHSWTEQLMREKLGSGKELEKGGG